MELSSSSDEDDEDVPGSAPEPSAGGNMEGARREGTARTEERVNRDHGDHSSSDEVTLAEPQSPYSRTNVPSTTSVLPQVLLPPALPASLSPALPSPIPEISSSLNSPIPPNSPNVHSGMHKTHTVAIFPTGKSLKIQVPTKPIKADHARKLSVGQNRGTESSLDGHSTTQPDTRSTTKGKGRARRASLHGSVEAQPSRIIRAFIATKLR